MEHSLFKIEYDWYEGEHEEILLGKDVKKEAFEKDLIEARNFARSLIGKEIKSGEYLGKGYKVECLPEFYEQIIWFRVNKKDYIVYSFDEDIAYGISDSADKEIVITKSENIIEQTEL